MYAIRSYYAELVAEVVGIDDGTQVFDIIERSEMIDRFIFRQRGAVLRALFALNGTAIAAMVFRLILFANRGPRILSGSFKIGLAEVLGRRHPSLSHQVNQRRCSVLRDPQIAIDHRRGLEQSVV